MTPNEAERRVIVANLRGALAGPNLTKALEEERRLEREREDVKDAQVERGVSFKQALNNSVRAGLKTDSQPSRRFRVHTHPLGVRPGVNLDKAFTLAGEMEDAEILRKLELRK
jgi:hypothetical protein